MNPFIMVLIALVAVFGALPIIVNAFLRNVEAGEIRLVSWMGGEPRPSIAAPAKR